MRADMIVNADGKALEWLAGTFLSKDQIAYKEIIEGVDQHTLNQEAFNLPSRLIAKTFVFRLIYGGSAYTYSNDPDFTHVSTSSKYWQEVIDKFKDKYKGWDKWWNSLIQEATLTGQVVNPYTFRIYDYEPKKGFNGDMKWPETTIKNYIVQGFGADLMALARVSFKNRFMKAKIDGYLVNTVHDSIVVDVDSKEVERVAVMFHEVFRDIPANFEKVFKQKFDLPVRAEVSYGSNMKELTEIIL